MQDIQSKGLAKKGDVPCSRPRQTWWETQKMSCRDVCFYLFFSPFFLLEEGGWGWEWVSKACIEGGSLDSMPVNPIAILANGLTVPLLTMSIVVVNMTFYSMIAC